MNVNVDLESNPSDKGRPSADTVRFVVYILICKDKLPYVGCTDNLKSRLERHKKGYVPATKNRLPFELKCYFTFKDKYLAFKFEQYLKSGSGRAFMKKHFLL